MCDVNTNKISLCIAYTQRPTFSDEHLRKAELGQQMVGVLLHRLMVKVIGSIVLALNTHNKRMSESRV